MGRNCVIQNGNALLYASNQLKNDLDLVKKCVLNFHGQLNM